MKFLFLLSLTRDIDHSDLGHVAYTVESLTKVSPCIRGTGRGGREDSIA